MTTEPLTEGRMSEIERDAALFASLREPLPGDLIDRIWLSTTSARVLLGLARRDVPELLAEIRRLRAERAP